MKRYLTAAVLAGGLVLVAPAITHAQEAPAPCTIDNWLERGMRDSDAVRCLQQTLTGLGIDTGPVDGYLGPITEGAVKSFQTSKGITVDGDVGPETASAFGADLVNYTGPSSDPTPDVVQQPRRRQQSSNSNSSSRSSSSNRSSGSSYSGPSGASGVNWDRVAQCESGQQWGHGEVTNRYGTFSGGLMIMNSAWRQFGGQEFAPTAGQASRAQQIIVAERIAARVGAARAWQCPVG